MASVIPADTLVANVNNVKEQVQPLTEKHIYKKGVLTSKGEYNKQCMY